ncbi:hypothetical protein HDV57DRAFT_484269 [Trichoderma longibrachiatum]
MTPLPVLWLGAIVRSARSFFPLLIHRVPLECVQLVAAALIQGKERKQEKKKQRENTTSQLYLSIHSSILPCKI